MAEGSFRVFSSTVIKFELKDESAEEEFATRAGFRYGLPEQVLAAIRARRISSVVLSEGISCKFTAEGFRISRNVTVD